MKQKTIFLTVPSLNVHGGIRVILEWANRLSIRHRVLLRVLKGPVKCSWFQLSPNVRIVIDDRHVSRCDLLLVTSPHSVRYLDIPGRHKRVIFLQMMEHMFQPHSPRWRSQCERLYRSLFPVITISRWGERVMREEFHRTGEVFQIGNGVNLDHFPVSHHPKDFKTVLVEGWVPTNATKDTEYLAPLVAKELRKDGYRIIAFSQMPLIGPYSEVPHEYYCCPSLEKLNSLYTRATILLKASKCDFRSCAPMEAMTKGTVTVRAIEKGDDDLVHKANCLRGPYDFEPLKNLTYRLLQNPSLHHTLSLRCLDYVTTYTWDYWMNQVENILWTS